MAINFFWHSDLKGMVPSHYDHRANIRKQARVTPLEVCRRYSILHQNMSKFGTKTISTYHETVNMLLYFVFPFVEIIRASSQFWMDIFLNKSAFIKMQFTENNVRPSFPLVAHQYCREYYPYETFYSNNGNNNREKNKYMNFTDSENVAAISVGSCTNVNVLRNLRDPTLLNLLINNRYNKCGCDTPWGQITYIELMIMMITMASAIFIIPFSSRLMNSNNKILTDKKIYKQHKSTVIIIIVLIVCIVPLPIYYLLYINGKGVFFDAVRN